MDICTTNLVNQNNCEKYSQKRGKTTTLGCRKIYLHLQIKEVHEKTENKFKKTQTNTCAHPGKIFGF